MGKINLIPLPQGSKKDSGKLRLNISVQNNTALKPGDVIAMAAGQPCCEKVTEINGIAREYRAMPVHLNGGVETISVNTLFGTRYLPTDKLSMAEKVGEFYRMSFRDWFANSKPRFRSLLAVVGVEKKDDCEFINVKADAAVELSDCGDCLVQTSASFEKTMEDNTTTVNSQGKEVRQYVYLQLKENYVAEK